MSPSNGIFARGMGACTAVSERCPVEATLYGYRPSLGWNAFFAVFFGVCAIVHIAIGIKHKTWTYMIGVALGCLAECGGYYGRLMMNDNPFDQLGFQIQVVLLIFAPSFLAAGIYLTLKHIVLNIGEPWSRLRPNFYTYIFITCDVTSLLMQSAGGALAAIFTDKATVDMGTHIMLAGIVWQVIVLVVFGYLVSEYAFRTYCRKETLSPEATAILSNRRFHVFVGGVFAAYAFIFIRCVYRIPELEGGWGNKMMRKQGEFIGLEGIMIMLAVTVQTVCHPGWCFPQMSGRHAPKAHSQKLKSMDSEVELVDRV